MNDDETLEWLLKGDASIRWQAMRDLCGANEAEFSKEREKVAQTGWGARLLKYQTADGLWGGGLYGPKWTSTTYTMLTLRLLGLPQNHPQAQKACAVFLQKGFYKEDGGINFFRYAQYSWKYSETCITGMILALLAYFRFPDERIHTIAKHLINQQMNDGGWNCESYKGATHSSFHTTISVLEGLLEYQNAFPQKRGALKRVRERAHEFLLEHRLYRSHRTGEIFDPAMTRMPFPPRWRYDFVRALDYFRAVDAQRDERMTDAISLLEKKRGKDRLWKMNSLMSGRKYFDMESAGQPSRWNTLRALRILTWWNK